MSSSLSCPALLAGMATLLSAPAISLAQSNSESGAVPSRPIALPAINVTATGLPAYMADKPSSVATKTELPPRQTPFSVDQATEELIQERGDEDIFDTLEGFAGLTTSSTGWDDGAGHIRNIQTRGVTTDQTLINGIRMYSTTSSGNTVRGVDNLESVELLRGRPASTTARPNPVVLSAITTSVRKAKRPMWCAAASTVRNLTAA